MQNLGDNTIPNTGSVLIGSVDGSIKLLTQLPQVSILYGQKNQISKYAEKIIEKSTHIKSWLYRRGRTLILHTSFAYNF